MRLFRRIAVPLLVLSLVSTAHGQTTWRVDDDCSPPGSGTKADPFCAIQHGVNASSDGDTVLVAPGVYTGLGNRDISLFGKLITLKSTAGPVVTTIDIQGSPTSIHRGFYLIHGETTETVIEGFTITNGFLQGDTGGSGINGGGGGAAVYIRAASPTIRNCVARGNTSESEHELFVFDGRGGAVLVDGESSASFENCIMADNVAAGRGGAMYIGFEASTVSIRNCLITGNTAGHGGGIYSVFGTTTVTNTAVLNNGVVLSGGGLHKEQGDVLLSNCIFWANETATVGPEIFVQGPALTIEASI